MNKKDLDALSCLYESVYSPNSGEYLSEAVDPQKDIGARMGRAISSTLRDVGTGAVKDIKNLVTKGRRTDTSERQRIRQGVTNFTNSAQNTLNRLGGYTKPVKPVKPAATQPAEKPAATQPAAKPAAKPAATQPAAKPAATQPAARPAAKPATPGSGAKVAPSSAAKPATPAPGTKAAGPDSIKPKTPNPLMQRTFGYQTGNAPDQIKAASAGADPKKAEASFARSKQTANKLGMSGSLKAISSGYEWPSAKTIRDIAGAYASIYEGKKKDQDQDGDNDFADVRIARMIASGMSKAEAIAAVKNKEYNEEFESWLDSLVEEGYDLSDYTMEEMFDSYLEEATRMRTARGSARSAGILTPREKKELGEVYEIVSSYLLENNFAETLNDANVIIENMSEVWLDEILAEKSGEQPLPYGRMMKKSDELADSDDKKKRKRAASIYLAANAPKGPKIKLR